MTPIQVVAVCLRFLAVIWLLHTLNHAYGAIWYVRLQSGMPEISWMIWIQAALQLVICAMLWFFPITIASRLLPSYSKPPDSQNPPRLQEWQTLGVICIGLWALSRAVPDLVYWVTSMGMAFDGDSPRGELAPDEKARFMATLAQIAIGAWLVLGAKGVAAILFKIRTAGVAK